MKSLVYITAFAVLTFVASAQNDPGQPVPEKPGKKGWIQLFDGKTLSGWTMPDPGKWHTEGDKVVGEGNTSHLFSPNIYTNLEFKAEVRTGTNSNSGMYFRAALGSGWPKGYEAQVNNTYKDPQKTAGLYNFHKVSESPAKDNEWWTQTVIAIGNRTIIMVNDKIITDYIDEKNTFTSGHLALQQHDPGSHCEYRNLVVKRLSSDNDKALKQATKDVPAIANSTPVKD
jgi:hypothetical protein